MNLRRFQNIFNHKIQTRPSFAIIGPLASPGFKRLAPDGRSVIDLWNNKKKCQDDECRRITRAVPLQEDTSDPLKKPTPST
jgi:hypothetical protein